VINEKQLLREKYKYRRNQMSPRDVAGYSRLIFQKIMNEQVYKEAQCIFVYMSFLHEVDTYDFIVDSLGLGKKVCIPKIIDKEMNFYQITSIDDVKKGFFDILEPISNEIILPEENDLMIIPGILFDNYGYRIGYGGGYYDQYIKRYSAQHFTKAGVAFQMQVLDDIPKESYDQKIDLLFTEELHYRFNKE